MNDLPPLAWVLLCAVVTILVVMNLALVVLVRNRNNLKLPPRLSRPAQSWQKMGNLITVLRDPFAEERKQLDELSALVRERKEDGTPGAKPGSQP
jgi:hypothetical protein